MMWLFFSCLLACTGKLVSGSCPLLEISPPRVVVRFGDSLSANCTSSFNQTAGMGWESPYGGVDFTKGVSSLPFKINSVPDWGMEPMCYVNLLDGEQCLKTLPVTVYKMPDSVSLKNLNRMVEGQQYAIQCDIVNVAPARNLSVLWHKGNKILFSPTFDESRPSPVNKSSVLNLTAHRDDDGAEFWCEAKLNLWPEKQGPPTMNSEPHKVTVLYPPTFFEPANETLEFSLGKNMTLNCIARGNPRPSYRWQIPNFTKEWHKSQDENRPILSRPFELPGVYTCTASNSQATVTKYFTVSEAPMSGDGCSLILKPSRVVLGFGESVSVSCEAARPVRVLGWESAISASHTQEERSVQWKVDSLIDWIEEPICYGVFFTAPKQCEEKLNLVLYKTPDSVSIRQANHTGPMVAGKEYQLLCEVQNIAPVQYLTLRWYRGQSEVYNHSFSDLTSSSPVQVSSILVITPTKAENGVQYRCVAELELGPEGPQPPPTVSSEPLNASVYFPPTFLNPEPEILDFIPGGEITLNCTATGNPTPVYSWQSSVPMQERVENEATVTSSSLLPGAYTCTASNTLEKKSKKFIVKAMTKGV